MNWTTKNTTPYTASDIEKYRKGELTARESNALEQAALEDPFLADALEGLTTTPASPQELTELHQRLASKVENTKRKRILPIWGRLSIAAAIILLLGIGYNLFIQGSSKLNVDRAVTVAKEPAATPPSAIPPTANPAAAKPPTANPPVDNSLAATPTTTPAPAPTTKQIAPPATARTLPAADATIASAERPSSGTSANSSDDKTSANRAEYKVSADSTAIVTTKARTDTIAASSDLLTNANTIAKARATALSRLHASDSTALDYRASRFYQTPAPLVYTGRVLDLKNNPVAGATLGFPGSSNLTVTDNQGQFKFSLPSKDSSQQMIVTRVGYDKTYLTLNNLSMANPYNNVIHLTPSNTNLDEVVVIGYGSKRKETKFAAPSESTERLDTAWTIATPIIGREAYLEYLNKTRKKLGLDSTITGTETVSFVVSRTGSLSNFKIEHSLSPAHDAGIIRLITEGPAWRLLRGRNTRASVTINF
jgi:hypothetical protein